MTTEHFDYRRMDVNLYNGLNSALDVPAFLSMASDYMQYLRTGPEITPMGRACADSFLEMIDNERAWPIVKFTIREFRDIDAVNRAETPELLKYVLRSIQPRMKEIHPLIRTTNLDKVEDLVNTGVIKATIDGVVYHLDGEEHASEEQRKVSSAMLDDLIRVQEELSRLPDVDDQEG